ncbi:DMT family transporter [Bradyrhizobium sp.]|uniref:DMT family transporter n=1 Tax=Bradyrhizobium sp. TaxID=376 RepID=UPI003C547831
MSAIGALAFVVLAWGINWILLKSVLVKVAPIEFTACRLLGSALLITLVRRALGNPVCVPADERMPLALVGLFQMTGALGLSLMALQHLPVGHGAILFYSMPFWLFLIEISSGASSISRLGVLAVAMTIGGLFVLQSSAGLPGRSGLLGVLLMLAAAVSWAIGIRFYRARQYRADIWSQTVWQLLASGLALAVMCVLDPRRQTVDLTPSLVAVVLFNWVVATGLAYAAWHHALANVTSTAASQTLMLVPLVATTAGVMIRGEHLGLASIAATILIVGGVSLIIWRETMRPGLA